MGTEPPLPGVLATWQGRGGQGPGNNSRALSTPPCWVALLPALGWEPGDQLQRNQASEPRGEAGDWVLRPHPAPSPGLCSWVPKSLGPALLTRVSQAKLEHPAKNNLEAEVGEGGPALETSLPPGPSCLAGAVAQDSRASEGDRGRV